MARTLDFIRILIGSQSLESFEQKRQYLVQIFKRWLWCLCRGWSVVGQGWKQGDQLKAVTVVLDKR